MFAENLSTAADATTVADAAHQPALKLQTAWVACVDPAHYSDVINPIVGPNFQIFHDQDDALEAARKYLFCYDEGATAEVALVDQHGAEYHRQQCPSVGDAYCLACEFNRRFEADGLLLLHHARFDRPAPPVVVRPVRWDSTSEADSHFELKIFTGQPAGEPAIC